MISLNTHNIFAMIVLQVINISNIEIILLYFWFGLNQICFHELVQMANLMNSLIYEKAML